MTWCRLAPVANNVTNSVTLPTSAGQVNIDPLSSTVDGTEQSYTITAIPSAAQGVLYYNTTGTTYAAVTNNLVLTPAQAASLRFEPATNGTASSASFSYRVTDDANLLSANTATFTIPLQVITPCAATSTLSFAAPRALAQDWKARTENVPATSALTTVTSGSYQTPASATVNTFETASFNGVQSLLWQMDYASTAANTSSVTFTFNRAVSNFTVRVQDIDKLEDANNSFTDRVTFTGTNAGTAVVPVLSPVTPNANAVIINGNTATGTVNNTSPDNATVIAYFAEPITSLTLTYSNISTASANPTANAVGIDFMDWCRLAPVANTITNTSVSNAAGQAPVNGLSSVVDGTPTYTLTALPLATQGILYVNGVAATVGQTLTAAQAAQLSFDPATTFAGTVSFNYSVSDEAGQTASAAYSIPVNASGAAGTPGPCATPGRDGSPTITANPNTYYPSTAVQSLTGGVSNFLYVGPATGTSDIAVGDLLLIIQMQGGDINSTNSDAYGDGVTGGSANGALNTNFTAGTYEYVVANSAVTAVAGGTIQLATTLRNSYQNDYATATAGQRRFQVIRVPQYSNLTLGATISPLPWNGNVGGIIAVDVAKQTNLNGFTIDASGAGFRGGAGRVLGGAAGIAGTDYRTSAALNANGTKGEGIAGTPRYVNNNNALLDTRTSTNGLPAALNDGYPSGDNGRGAPGNAGGGGTDANPSANDQNTGGGGGANGGRGGRGGNAWASNAAVGGEPGAAFTAVSSSRLILGGGGGAGSTNNASGTPGAGFASSGAAGGGIVMLRTATINGTGSILANGANANNTVANDGSGGGGAGGSILITAATPAGLSNLTLTANGGTGGTNTTTTHGPGGGGGGGVILTNAAAAASNITAGANGTTGGVAYGSEAGAIGASNAQISTSIANSTSGANCPADVTTTISGPTTVNTNQASGAYSVTFTNNGTSTASNVTQLVTLPAGATVTAAQLPAGATFTTAGTVTTINFGTVATLASGAGNTYAFSYTTPPTSGSYSLTSTVGTDANQGANTAPDVASLTIQVNGAPANCQPSYLNNSTVSSGLTAEYYAGYFNDNVSYFQRASPLRRLDPQVNFNSGDGITTWGDLSVVAGGSSTNYDNYSSRYRGSIYITTAGSYTFYLTSDDASYMWLDGAALAPTTSNATINNGGLHSPTTVANTITLSAGAHDITVVFGENGGTNRLLLEYESTALGISRQAVPSSILCAGPATTNVPPVAQNVTNTTLLSSAGATVLSPNLSGSDTDGTVSYFNILTLPSAASGVLTYNNTAVVAGQAIPAGSLNLLRFVPSTSFNGNATFTYSVTDNNGRTDTNGITGAAATYTIPVNGTADVTTTLSGPTNLNPGQATSNYTAAFTNNGPNPAVSVTQRVTLPAGATNVFVNGVAYVPSGNVIDFGTAASLAAGATNIFSFSFTAPTTTGSAAISSNVTTTTTQGADTAPNTATLNATVGSPANVAATISAGAGTVTAGQSASFNVNFSNAGPATAAGVVASVQLPAGLGAVTASNGGVYDNATGIVTYAGITSYNSGGSTASVISFTAPASGPVTATASIRTTTSEAGQTANNTQSASISVTPTYDVTTSITGPTSTAVGVQTTFSVMTINNGPSMAPSVVQTVTGLPTNLTNVYVSNGGTYDAASGTVTFPALEAMANGARVDNTISFTPTSTTAGFTATATATANGTNPGDSNTGNNSVAASAMAVNAAPAAATNANIYTTITTPSANVLPGDAVTFTVTSGNRGAATATAVAQQTTLPAGLSNVVVRDANNNVVPNTATTGYNSATGVVVVPNVASIQSGTTTSYSVSFTAPASGMVAGVATISSANADSMPADNISTADVTVMPTTDLVVRLTGPASVVSGSSATYTVTTTNNGPATATNVVTTVAIPAGLTGVTVSGGGTYNAATGVVTFPATASLLNGSATSNTITYTEPNMGTVRNVASATSTTVDSQPANNTASVATQVKGMTDVTVALNGPATIVQGNQVDYVVSAINNGQTAAANTVIKVQLPTGLSNVITSNGSYNATTGVVTFSTIASQAAGRDGAVSYGIRFIAPSTLTSLYAAASVSTDSEESSYTNNTATTTTAVAAPTTGQADLQIAVTPSTNSPVAGQSMTLNVVTTNLAASTVAATNVVTRVSIEPGLTVTSITNGGTYDPATGVVTFPALSSLAIGASVPNSVVFVVPGATPLTTRGLVSGDQSDPSATNNVDFQSLTVSQRADVATTISGPATTQPGDLVTYSVSTINNGPSVANGVVQKVTIPAGATNVVISGGGMLSGNEVTFPTINNQVAGANGAVVNTISFNAPATITTPYSVVANVTTTSTQPTTPGTANDVATATTARGNRAPVANAVVNSLRTPEGNTAGALAISPLSGTDADGNATITSYTITSIPDATTQGVLRLNGTPVTAGTSVLAADVANLTFDPVASFVGNAFFTYTATDNAGAVSAPAIYTIPVGQDISAVYTLTTPKGGATPYQNGDVIANVFDVNGGAYNSAATPVVTNTGIQTATLTSGTLPAGTTLDPVTGIITVTNRLALVAGSYPVTVTTIDAYGGTNTSTFTIVIGTRPLPVELATFEVRAVKVDALLDWTTASEKNNDRFEVERSLNGSTFEKIGTVRGQGTTQATTAYNFKDAGIGARTQSLVYYRLRQIDLDGTVSYSPVRTVRFEAQAAVTAKLSVFPNPATTADRVVTLDLSTLPKGTYQALLVDAAGRILGTYSVEGGINKTVDVQNLPTGTYIIQVRGNGLKLSERLLKE
ncbi:T9SS type A sorting domain-containing protein [Hymenobacter sp. BT186]|uniref:T9SS type A sorting domain-containing protein n=1 Tax=Hymenobacter telluris TaxID=2816474 RepID=A0A939EZH6_9BACT|nr:PA14 domain-containing protein [Hymenobacter telluris]MBO0359405.1 T9SS type A sorting domain-containing protein [Hymenobacter telluris]MBW3375431.1 T9SS type A sorting domain-containing protein [Hymenobacter norwichensis]